MPLPIPSILGILSDNLKKRGSVLPLSKKAATGWAKGLNIPRGGKTILYTGHMYQLIPAIDAMSSQMAMFENSFITRFFGIGRFFNKFINLSFFMSLTASGEKKREFNGVLRQIATLLQKAGVDFGYLYEQEMYSGALIYDEGLDEVLEHHIRKVCEIFRRNGVRKIITVDPHTTHMLRYVYPRFVPSYDIEVESYLETLANALAVRGMSPTAVLSSENLTIHDSCVYARYEAMTEPHRQLLRAAGVKIHEPELSGKSTHCCGGPIEALFPTEAHRIAHTRRDQLKAASNNAVAMCPICLVNLRKASAGTELKVDDISNILSRAYL